MREFWIQKKPALKQIFNVANDAVPEELLDSGAVRFEGNYVVYDNKEADAGYFTTEITPDTYLAWEEDPDMPNGYNIWHKRNAEKTVVKTDEGYFENPTPVLACEVTKDAVPNFVKVIGKVDADKWLVKAHDYNMLITAGQFLWTCYNYEEFLKGAPADFAALELNTKSAKEYFVQTLNNAGEPVLIPLLEYCADLLITEI